MAHHSRAGDHQASSHDIRVTRDLLSPAIPKRKYFIPPASITSRSSREHDLDGIDNGYVSSGNGQHARESDVRTSNTWTSSGGDMLSDRDDIDDRSEYIQEYNRLAAKHCVRALVLYDYDTDNAEIVEKSNWFKRNILRRTSSTQSARKGGEPQLNHRRSFSDLSLRLKARKDILKDKNLQDLVRLCGSSLLYLPVEYATHSLSLPTCFRATAQFLVQYGVNARGVFRIPGSSSIISALYNHYCTLDEDGGIIAGTVRCPTLPSYIKCDVHDVASAFKRFLSGLRNGFLGSQSVFYALVSIHSQLNSNPELTRTKESKLRARLVALAIMTLKSHYRRDLVCAVFGLLSMIGRAAEIAPREDGRGRPLPTSDLMGYAALGIIFGPLLMGDLLDSYTMRVADTRGPLVLFPVSPPKNHKEKHSHARARSRSKDHLHTNMSTHKKSNSLVSQVDKMKVANEITEMLITHWRDVVCHMRALQSQYTPYDGRGGCANPPLRSSASESFVLHQQQDWEFAKDSHKGNAFTSRLNRIVSQESSEGYQRAQQQDENLSVRKQRSMLSFGLGQALKISRSLDMLFPSKEEFSTPDWETSPRDLKPPPTAFTPKSSTITQKPNVATSRPAEGQPSHHSKKTRNENGPLANLALSISMSRVSANATRRSQLAATDPGPPPHKSHEISRTHSDSTPRVFRAPKAFESLISRQPLQRLFTDDKACLNSQARFLPSDGPINTDLRSRPSGDIETTGQRSITLMRKCLRKAPTQEAQAINVPKAPYTLEKTDSSTPSPLTNLTYFGSQKRRHSNRTSSTKGYSISSKPASVENLKTIVPTSNYTRATAMRPATPNARKLYQKPQVLISKENSPHRTVRALAAKFNFADSTSHFALSPEKSPSRGPLKDNHTPSGSPRNAVAAAYTVNPLSPLKSQRSMRSRKSNKTVLREVGISLREPPKDLNPKKELVQPAKRLSGDLSHSPSPQTPHIVQSRSTPELNDNPCSRDNLLYPPISSQKYPSYPAPTIMSPLHFRATTEIAKASSGRFLRDDPSFVDSIPARSASLYDTPRKVNRASIIAPFGALAASSQSIPSADNVHSRSKIDAQNSPDFAKAVEVEEEDVPKNSKSPKHHQNNLQDPNLAVVRNFSTPRRMRISEIGIAVISNPRFQIAVDDPAPSISQAVQPISSSCISGVTMEQLAPPITPSCPRPMQPSPAACPHPSRSNSVLSARVHAYRKEVEENAIEIYRLRQKFDTRAMLTEAGTLCEQLRAAKEEARMWRSRAQIAEKQIEVLTKMSSRSSSTRRSNVKTLLKQHSQLGLSNLKQGENSAEINDNERKPLHRGLDGASSFHRHASEESRSSENSSGTIIRSLVITGVRYSA